MTIYYIPLGSFCYPKMIIRETDREFKESLPFDFNSSPNLQNITNILKELYYNGNYEIELKEILEIYGDNNELSVSERNMYLVHFFKDTDLIKNPESFPCSAYEYINKDKINNVIDTFNKRFKRLLNILNNPEHIICFMRIENYDNHNWNYELKEFTQILSLFKNPNKYLIYTQKLIDDEIDFKNTNVLNYNYDIPILFYKHYFYDMEMYLKKHLFINILKSFENIIYNIKNVINIRYNNIIEQYYIDNEKKMIFKLSNMKYFSTFFIENNNLYINNVISGYQRFIKNNDNIYE
jgi:hypothetical protein